MSLGHRAVALVTGLVIAATACGSANPARNPSLAGPAPSDTASSAVAGPASGSRCPPNAGFTGAVNDHGAVAVKGTKASIEAGDFFFSPTCQTGAPASGNLTLVVQNVGQALHNVSVRDQNIDMDVSSGQTIAVTLNATATPFTFFCKYHRTSGMVGAIVPAGT
jgi:plastocyanin